MNHHPRATKAAQELLGDVSKLQLPIDVRKLVKLQNIFLVESPHENKDLSGAIIKSPEKTLIVVNSLHSENRKRFTIAHELGHYRLHKDKDVFVDRASNFSVRFRRNTGGNHSPEESEANSFAAELLMPAQLVKRDFKNMYKNLKESLGKLSETHFEFIIKSLAEKFGVSAEAMEIRIDILRKS